MKDEGLVSVVLVALLSLIALLCMATADAANVLLARLRAQSAADATALAAAAARLSGEGEDPYEAAESIAGLNGASLESCGCAEGEETAVVVSIGTRVRLLGVAPSRVEARAVAALDPGRVFRPPG